MKASSTKNALLEIGTEELPARFIPEAERQLHKLISDGLAKSGVDSAEVKAWGTPRRLAVFISGASARAKDRIDVAIGPPPKAAKDADGKWTAAATGFAKTQGISV